LDDPDASIEELSSRLIELLVDKRKLSDEGPGYINRRHQAINEGLVNCLILIMLEAIDTHEWCIPAPLMMLLRDRLCGPDPDLRRAYLSRPARSLAIRVISLEGDEISVRELAAITGVSKNTANRWLHDEDFKREVEEDRRDRAAEEEHSKSFVQSMQVRFSEACDMDALAVAWNKHVKFIEPLLPFWAQDECRIMFKHRQQEIANETNLQIVDR
jgi:transposase